MNSAPWWAVLLAGVVGALTGLGGTLLATWRQNRRAGREEWFRRVQWAQSLTVSKDGATQEAGYRILLRLGESNLAGPADAELIYELRPAAGIAQFVDGVETLDDVEFVSDTEQEQEDVR